MKRPWLWITVAIVVVLVTGRKVVNAFYGRFDPLVENASKVFGVPVAWIKAVIGKESSFRVDPPVRKGDESYGLMQITPATARGLGFSGRIPEDLIVPETNIYFGSMLLGQLRKRYGNNFAAVYSAYNSGSATKYRTSTEVATNVKAAQVWLERFV